MLKIKHKCLLTSLAFFSLIFWRVYAVYGQSCRDSDHIQLVQCLIRSATYFEYAGILVALVLGSMLMDVFYMSPPDSHTCITLSKQYLMLRLLNLVLLGSRRRLEWYTCNVMKYQEALLKEILSRAKDTAYAKDMNLCEVKTLEDFSRVHPLADYEKIKPYVDRAVLGEPCMLIKDKVEFFAATTGTSSGKSKLFPLNQRLCDKIDSRGMMCMVEEFTSLPGHAPLSRGIQIHIKFDTLSTELGVPIGPASQMAERSLPGGVTPMAGLRISNMRCALYIQLLFGLSVSDIGWIFGSFSSHTLSFFRLLEECWDELCFDIQMGRVSCTIELTVETRKALNAALKPNRNRAMELRKEFHKGFKNIVTRIWPNCTLVLCLATGPFQSYADIIRDKYLGGIIPFSPVHLATEGDYGINLVPLSRVTRYTILPNSTFYEFIAFEDVERKEPRTYLANEVVVGNMYEIVVTTLLGVYRYRTNDIIRIVGHYNEAPMYEFVQRMGDNLDLLGEKTTAAIIQTSLQAAFLQWPHMELTDYTCTESVNIKKSTGDESSLLYYVMFLEILNDVPVAEGNMTQLDDVVRVNQEEYDGDRKSDRIKPLRIIQVKSGTFENFKHLLISSNRKASFAQLKIPRVIRREEHIRLMLDGAV